VTPDDQRVADIRFESGPHVLAATLVRPAGGPRSAPEVPSADAPERASPGLLFVHGLGSDRRGYVDRARRAADELGATCLAVDLSGHGTSSGVLDEITPRQHLHEVATAFDELAGQPEVAPGRVGVCAASYGACLAALLTRERDVARLLLRAPGVVADRDLDRPLRHRSRDRSLAQAPTLVDALRGFRRPLMVVESERDEVIPAALVQEYLATAPGARRGVIPGAGHALTEPAWREAFERVLLAFFRGI
jgi:pimeloyl-ACP methyl ester carboxylesterase